MKMHIKHISLHIITNGFLYLFILAQSDGKQSTTTTTTTTLNSNNNRNNKPNDNESGKQNQHAKNKKKKKNTKPCNITHHQQFSYVCINKIVVICDRTWFSIFFFSFFFLLDFFLFTLSLKLMPVVWLSVIVCCYFFFSLFSLSVVFIFGSWIFDLIMSLDVVVSIFIILNHSMSSVVMYSMPSVDHHQQQNKKKKKQDDEHNNNSKKNMYNTNIEPNNIIETLNISCFSIYQPFFFYRCQCHIISTTVMEFVSIQATQLCKRKNLFAHTRMDERRLWFGS